MVENYCKQNSKKLSATPSTNTAKKSASPRENNAAVNFFVIFKIRFSLWNMGSRHLAHHRAVTGVSIPGYEPHHTSLPPISHSAVATLQVAKCPKRFQPRSSI